MKPPREWTLRDVLGFSAGEQDWLERKGSRALDLSLVGVDENRVRSELSVTLSAIANSGGGQLIFGLDDAGSIDGGGVSCAVRGGTKSWLEDIIPNLVEFPLRGFAVFELADPPGGARELGVGKALYVVDVPDSEDAPHQAMDRRYYARLGGKSLPLRHRMVLDILARRKYPFVEPIIESARDKARSSADKHCYRLGIRLTNRGPIRPRDYLLRLKIPKAIPAQDPEIQFVQIEQIAGQEYVVYEYPSGAIVLFPGFTVEVPSRFIYEVDQNIFQRIRMDDLELVWQTFADDMPPREGRIPFSRLQEW